jgi:hypothetical protein
MDFLKELLNPKGTISAPQTMGCLLSLVGCILAIFHYGSDTLMPLLSAGGALLVGGSFEVYAHSRWGK